MTITVRRMRFEFPADLDPIIIEGSPEESYAQVALSLLLPYLEPYLIRTMKAARSAVTDPALAQDLDKFIGQEGQHYRQHMAFNAFVHARGYEGLEALEKELDDDYRRYTSEKSLRFNLAYAEGFEALTTAMACTFLEMDRSRWHAAALDLYMWHLIEELEHRTVAFDVYEHVCGNYPYRLAVGMFAQWHLVRFILRAGRCMLDADPRALADHGGEAGRKTRERELNEKLRRLLLPRVLRTYLPSYTPRDIEMPSDLRELADEYTNRAVSTA